MDLGESMFIRKVFIKERGAEIFRKIRPYPFPVIALKSYSATLYSCWLLGNKLPTAHTDLSVAFYSQHTAVRNGAMNKFGIFFHRAGQYL
jgi:hypothetical protein